MKNQPTIAFREAQTSIIAAVLNNRVNPFDVDLTGAEFESEDFRDIFLASKVLLQTNETVDFITLSNYLAVNNNDSDKTPPNPTVLANLAASDKREDIKPALNLLFAANGRKQLKNLGTQIGAWAENEAASPVEIVDSVRAELENIAKTLGETIKNYRTFAELAPVMAQIYTELHEGISHNIPTGFQMLDQITGGGADGEVWVVGAKTGNGKSALALQMARHQSTLGLPSMIISREMNESEIYKREHSAVSGTPLWAIRPSMNDATFGKLIDSIPEISKSKILLDSVSADIHTVCKQIKKVVEAEGVRVVYVDYLQLIQGSVNSRMNRTEEIAFCSKLLKQTAMANNIWIVILAQYNRTANYAETAENHSFDGSSQIEKDASVILHLELEQIKLNPGEMPPKWRKATLRWSKARNAPLGSSELWFKGETVSFSEQSPFQTYMSGAEEDMRFQ